MSDHTRHPTPTESTAEPASETAETEQTEVDHEELCCPECGSHLVQDEAHGETVCPDCGLVVDEEQIDHGPDWRAFDAAERDEKSRVGTPTTQLMHDQGLSTSIGWDTQDAAGNPLSGRQRHKMQRLRTWDERFRTRDHMERNLKQALSEIKRMGAALGLPDHVRETAAVIFRRAHDEDLLVGRSIEGVATASLYAAARQADTPRSLDEFAPVSRIDKQRIARTYRYINQELGLAVQPATPESYLPRYTSELDCSDVIERRAHELLEAARRDGVHSGKNPVGLAAAAIYAAGLVTGDQLTQTEISSVTDVSAVTIRNRYPELLEATDTASPA